MQLGSLRFMGVIHPFNGSQVDAEGGAHLGCGDDNRLQEATCK